MSDETLVLFALINLLECLSPDYPECIYYAGHGEDDNYLAQQIYMDLLGE